ncbi:hypothetical protein K474DRAFT_1649179 [Panus rudis PR-1116 ss-1]|nr:hypothetical protein K474DRAFT_1649179 [Panus rudis PR-1116 ss-1]
MRRCSSRARRLGCLHRYYRGPATSPVPSTAQAAQNPSQRWLSPNVPGSVNGFGTPQIPNSTSPVMVANSPHMNGNAQPASQPNHLLMNQQHPNQIPSRSNATPMQQQQNGVHASPNLMTMHPQPPNAAKSSYMAFPHMAYPHETRFQTTPHQPLDEAVFQKAHAQYLQKNRASIDEQLLNMDGRLINLYALHREVMQAGGYAALVRRANEDPWSIIAANLGFVNFPANGTEPARSGPGAATRVHQVYCMYLRGFDYAYLMHKHGKSIQQNANDAGPSSSGPGQNMKMNGGMLQANIVQNHPMNPQAQRNPVAGLSAITELLRNMDPGKAQEMLSFASLSREQMQARGVRPDTINLVDTNRPLLQRLSQSQGQFHMSLKAAMSNGQFSANMPSGGPAPAEQQSSQAHQHQQSRQNMAQHMQANMAQQMLNQGQMNAAPAAGWNGQPSTMPPQMQGQQQMSQLSMNAQGHMQRGPVQPGQQQQPGRMPNRTEVLLHKGSMIVENMRREAQPIAVLQGPPRNLSEADKAQYPAAFAELLRLTTDIDKQLPMFAVVLPQSELKQIIHIVANVSMQKNKLAQQTPQYYLDLPTIKHLQASLATHWANVKRLLQNRPGHDANGGAQQQNGAHPPGPPPSGAMQPPPVPSHMMQQQQPQSAPQQSQMSHQQPHQSQLQPSQPQPVPQPNVQHPPPSPAQTHSVTPQPAAASIPPTSQGNVAVQARKKPENQASSPAASASTPVANPPTPTHVASSPQTPKSPKTKAKPRQPAKSRKPTAGKNTAGPSQTPQASTPAGPSSSTATAPSPAPAASAPTPTADSSASTEIGQKRRREEEPPTAGPSTQGSPSKKLKTEWDGPVSEELAKKQQEVEEIKSNEDAVKFLEQKQNEVLQAGEEGVQDVNQTLQEILSVVDFTGMGGMDFSGLNFSAIGDDGSRTTAGSIDDWLDLSSYPAVDDSKAATPDLVHTSSTNPSPESAPDSDANHGSSNSNDNAKIADNKDDFDWSLSFMDQYNGIKPLAGNEATFYINPEFDYENPMPASSDPWAISSSS